MGSATHVKLSFFQEHTKDGHCIVPDIDILFIQSSYDSGPIDRSQEIGFFVKSV